MAIKKSGNPPVTPSDFLRVQMLPADDTRFSFIYILYIDMNK